MKPLKNFILIKQDSKKSKSGLIMKTMNVDDSKVERAQVLAVGPEVQWVKKGDVIIFKNYNLFVVELEGKEYSFIPEDETLAVL